MKELQNYHTIQDDSLKNLTQDWTLNQIQPTVPSTADYPLPQPLTPPKTIDWGEFRRTGLHKYPHLQKGAILGGMYHEHLKYDTPDALAFLMLSSTNLQMPQQYIAKNGILLESISQLSDDFQNIVRKKLLKELYVDDAKGLILYPNSTLAQEIAVSPELSKFIKTHLIELLRGDVISGSEIFASSKNLYYTLKKADILDTYINKNGDIISLVLDTYDFNKKDPDWKVEWARNVQAHGLLTGFYSITIVVVPKKQWIKWCIGL